MSNSPEKVVVIREADCIGCAKCLPLCPTNAIIGAAKQQHVIVAPLCIGCGLCIPPCPTDCIEWDLLPEMDSTARKNKALLAKHQIHQRKEREEKLAQLKKQKDIAASVHIETTLSAILEKL